MNLVLANTASTAGAPAGFGLLEAFLEDTWFPSRFADVPGTLTLTVGYGDIVNWGTLTEQALPTGVLGESQVSQWTDFNYTGVYPLLSAHLTSVGYPTDLPGTMPDGTENCWETPAQETALGQTVTAPYGYDGSIGIASTADGVNFDYGRGTPGAGQYDAFGVFTHEITEAMGRVDNLGSPGADIQDLFRWETPGLILSEDARGGYFSLDGGNTDLQNYSPTIGDPGDWNGANPNDPFNYTTPPATYTSAFTGPDIGQINADGFTWTPGNSAKAGGGHAAGSMSPQQFAISEAQHFI